MLNDTVVKELYERDTHTHLARVSAAAYPTAVDVSIPTELTLPITRERLTERRLTHGPAARLALEVVHIATAATARTSTTI